MPAIHPSVSIPTVPILWNNHWSTHTKIMCADEGFLTKINSISKLTELQKAAQTLQIINTKYQIITLSRSVTRRLSASLSSTRFCSSDRLNCCNMADASSQAFWQLSAAEAESLGVPHDGWLIVSDFLYFTRETLLLLSCKTQREKDYHTGTLQCKCLFISRPLVDNHLRCSDMVILPNMGAS